MKALQLRVTGVAHTSIQFKALLIGDFFICSPSGDLYMKTSWEKALQWGVDQESSLYHMHENDMVKLVMVRASVDEEGIDLPE
jgi:hypothetical protein